MLQFPMLVYFRQFPSLLLTISALYVSIQYGVVPEGYGCYIITVNIPHTNIKWPFNKTRSARYCSAFIILKEKHNNKKRLKCLKMKNEKIKNPQHNNKIQKSKCLFTDARRKSPPPLVSHHPAPPSRPGH